MITRPKDNEVHLREFVAWARWRRTQRKDASVCEASFEYVVSEIEKLLNGEKAFQKTRGRPENRELMWECFWQVFFAPIGQDHMPRHKGSEGGAFSIVGKKLGLSASGVEGHYNRALKLYETPEGHIEFSLWLGRKMGANYVRITPKNARLNNEDPDASGEA
jgi:hypothetical protein